MPTPCLAFRIPAERHGLVRAVVERLKAADGTGDPAFPGELSALVATAHPPMSIDRLTEIEHRLAAVEEALARRPPHPARVTDKRDPALVAFGAAVRRARTTRKLRLRDLAAAIHLNERTIRMVEKAKGGNPNTRRRLAEHLGLPVPGASVMISEMVVSRPRPHVDGTNPEVTHTD